MAMTGVFGFDAYAADSSTLYLTPSGGSYVVGDTFSVSIKVYSGDIAINAAEGILHFTSDTVEVESVSKDNSIFTLWTEDPAYSNEMGTLRFSGGLPHPGYTGSQGTVLDLIFRVKNTGAATMNFSDARILASDGKGTNVLAGTGGGSYVGTYREALAVRKLGRSLYPFVIALISVLMAISIVSAFYFIKRAKSGSKN